MKSNYTNLILIIALTLIFVSSNNYATASFYQPSVAARPDTTNKQDLLKKIQTNGSVVIVVTYRMNHIVRERNLNEVQRQAQRQEIDVMHQTFVQDIQQRKLNVTIGRKLQLSPTISMTVDEKALLYLFESPLIESIREIRISKSNLSQSTGIIGSSNVNNYLGLDGSGQTIVIIDDGVDRFHPTFGGRVIDGACFSTTVGDYISLCPNGEDSMIGTPAGENCNDNDVECEHGTHVAGIAAGANGVAPKANIVSIVVASKDTSANCAPDPTPCVRIQDIDIAAALEHVVFNHQSWSGKTIAINLSLGGGNYPATCDNLYPNVAQIIDDLTWSNGISVVASSGNDRFTNGANWPSCHTDVISVGATTKQDIHWVDNSQNPPKGSNAAVYLDLVAPGADITSAIPNGQYAAYNGTSMAAPHVAGTIALMNQANPNLDDEIGLVRTILQTTAVDVPDMSPYTSTTLYGHGRLNSFSAVIEALKDNIYATVYDYNHTIQLQQSQTFQDAGIYVLAGKTLTVNGSITLNNSILYLLGTLQGSGTITLTGDSEIRVVQNGVNNFQGTIYDQTTEYPLTIQNDFGGGGFESGSVGIGVNASPISLTSPQIVSVYEGSILNLQAYDNQSYLGINWVYNDNEDPVNKSDWVIERLQGIPIVIGSAQSISYTTFSDDGNSTLSNILKQQYTVADRALTEYGTYTGTTYDPVVALNSRIISVPPTKIINGKTLYFSGWSDGISSNPRTVTPSGNAPFTALYKGSQLSSLSTAFANSSQRKIVRSTNGWNHMVYESLGHIWYEAKSPSGNWGFVQGDNGLLHLNTANGKTPAIARTASTNPWSDMTLVAWQEGTNIILRVHYYNSSLQKYVSGTDLTVPTGMSSSYNVNPSVTWSDDSGFLLVFESTAGLQYRLFDYIYGTTTLLISSGVVPGTNNGDSKRPAVSSYADTGNAQTWFDVAWEKHTYTYSPSFGGTHPIQIIQHLTLNYNGGSAYWSNSIPTNVSSLSVWHNSNISITSLEFGPRIGWISNGFQSYYPSVSSNKASIRNPYYGSLTSYDSYVRSVSVASNDNAGAYYFAWSQIYDQVGWNDFNKFVAGSDLGTIKTLNTNGWSLQLVNGPTANDMRASSFYPKTVPYYFQESNTLGSYLKEAPQQNRIARGISISLGDSAISLSLDNLIAADLPIRFVEVDEAQLRFINRRSNQELVSRRERKERILAQLVSEPFQLKPGDIFGLVEQMEVFGTIDSVRFSFELESVGKSAAPVQLRSLQTITDYTPRQAHNFRLLGITPGLYRLVIRVDSPVDAELLLLEHIQSGQIKNEDNFQASEVIEIHAEMVTHAALLPNFPNPFNPSTMIGYQLPEAGPVSIQVFDVTGRLVATLVDGQVSAGRHQVRFDAGALSSGVYLVRMQSGGFLQTQKMVLVK